VARWGRSGLAVSGPFGSRCLNIPTLLRFHIPLIEPDVRICRIRLSDGFSRPAYEPTTLPQQPPQRHHPKFPLDQAGIEA
jgi:hypothetical protein